MSKAMRAVLVLSICELVLVLSVPAAARAAVEWVAHYGGLSEGGDYATSIAVDDSCYVYVTGESEADYATIKYTPSGDTAWVRRYNGPADGDDHATAIAVDDSGYVYVTGWSSSGVNTERDFVTIKYSETGVIVWLRHYNGPGDGTDEATTLAVDNDGNVLVTGPSVGASGYADYATIKYAPDGTILWIQRYDGPLGLFDAPCDLAVE